MMKMYTATIPLFYKNIPYTDENPNTTSDVKLYLKKSCLFNNFNNELSSVNITESEGKIFVHVEGITANDEDEALNILRKLLINICQCLTFLVQSRQYNIHLYHIYFSWYDRNINLNLETDVNPLCIMSSKNNTANEKIYMRDSISITMKKEIDLRNFENLSNIICQNSDLRFMMKAYYVALSNSDFSSKYYSLFTIIEYLEQNYISKMKFDKIIPEEIESDILKKIIEIVKDKMSGYDQNKLNDNCERIKSRVGGILRNATIYSRSEKLERFLVKNCNIRVIDTSEFCYQITKKKIQKFIDMRNSLFHGKMQNREQEKYLRCLTNELLLLCQKIIEIEIQNLVPPQEYGKVQ